MQAESQSCHRIYLDGSKIQDYAYFPLEVSTILIKLAYVRRIFEVLNKEAGKKVLFN